MRFYIKNLDLDFYNSVFLGSNYPEISFFRKKPEFQQHIASVYGPYLRK
jgi:hypothetical protein